MKLAYWEKEELETLLAGQLHDARRAKVDREQRWRRNRDLYYNEPGCGRQASEPWQWSGNFNLVQVKGDQIQGGVVDAVTSQEPWCVCIPADPAKDTSLREKAVSWFLSASGAKRKLRECASKAFWANRGCLKVKYLGTDQNESPRLEVSDIRPQDLVVYPAFADELDGMVMVGECYSRLRGEIKMLQEEGVYLKTEPLASSQEFPDPIPNYGASAPPKHVPTTSDYDRIVIYDLHVRKPGMNQWFRCVYAEQDQKVLLFDEDNPVDVPPYAVFRLKVSKDGDGFWPSTSVAQDLQQAQNDINHAFGTAMDAMSLNGNPATFGAMDSSNSVKLKPGGVYDVAEGAVQAVMPHIDASGVAQLVELLKAHGDEISRASSMGAGVTQPGIDSATEAELIGAGAKAGVDDYILLFASGVEDLCRLVDSLLRKSVADWWPVYGGRVAGMQMQTGQSMQGQADPRSEMTPEQVADVYAAAADWKLAIMSSSALPRSMMQLYQLLMQAGAQLPQLGYDEYELGKRLLQQAERMGIPQATAIQIPRDPAMAVEYFARELGIDPALVAAGLQQAVAAQAQQVAMGGVGGQPAGPGVPGASAPGGGQGPAQPPKQPAARPPGPLASARQIAASQPGA